MLLVLTWCINCVHTVQHDACENKETNWTEWGVLLMWGAGKNWSSFCAVSRRK
jgi:hypothetical protein